MSGTLTLGTMKTRVAQELRRDDLTTEIANAITSAIAYYQYDRFQTFNTSSLQPGPMDDVTASNPWMNDVEELIRTRAKAELYAHVMKKADIATAYYQLADDIKKKFTGSVLYQSLANYTVGTQGYLKARIANEIERGDLVNEVAAAVSTAIAYYQNERAYFNESRENTLTTNATQFKYTSTDASWIGSIIKIDYAMVYIGGLPYRILPLQPVEQEWSHLQSPATDPVGQPYRFTYYQQNLFIYPTPDQAYTIRVGGQFVTSAPPDDVTVSVWTSDCEDLIRCRAKYELYMHIPQLQDVQKAMTFRDLADQAFGEIKKRAADLDKDGDYEVHAWGY